MSKIYFNKGDIIECPNGHYICEIGINVYVGDKFSSDAFINFKDTPEPKLGTLMNDITCNECGENWVKYFHVRDKGSV